MTEALKAVFARFDGGQCVGKDCKEPWAQPDIDCVPDEKHGYFVRVECPACGSYVAQFRREPVKEAWQS